jgi:hypothetical protein
MNSKLIKAVSDQLGSDGEELKTTFQDISNHGIDGGYGGFVYYSDTIEFFKKNRKEIVELVVEMSEEFGQTPIEFVRGFNCLKNTFENAAEAEAEISRALYGRLSKDDTQVPNALAWFAGEEVARYMVDQEEENQS